MKETSYFGGTAYLGIPHNQKFKEFVFEGINRYGINFGASRNNNLSLDIFEIAEKEAARRSGKESAIIVSSGYLAAQLVIQHYLTDHTFIYAPETHPALWIGRPSPPKMSFGQWADETVSKVNATNEQYLIITNSVNNLFPEIYDFNWLKKIDPRRKTTILIDDSHGLGITGPNGEGVSARVSELPNVEVIIISSMAKALGVDAGVVLAKSAIINQLRSSSIYAGASPPSPGILYAFANSENIYRDELEKLRFNMKFFRGFISELKTLKFVDDFPVFLLEDPNSGDKLKSKGILISSFAYPDPQSKPLNRLVLNSTHSKEQLRDLAAILHAQEKVK